MQSMKFPWKKWTGAHPLRSMHSQVKAKIHQSVLPHDKRQEQLAETKGKWSLQQRQEADLSPNHGRLFRLEINGVLSALVLLGMTRAVHLSLYRVPLLLLPCSTTIPFI